MFQPILINKPDLITITPSPTARNNYLEFVIPADSVASIVIVPTVDTNMSVDNFNVCTQLDITIAGKIGDSAFSDKISMKGLTSFTTTNNKPIIVKEQIAIGANKSTVRVISCGQTSTTAE